MSDARDDADDKQRSNVDKICADTMYPVGVLVGRNSSVLGSLIRPWGRSLVRRSLIGPLDWTLVRRSLIGPLGWALVGRSLIGPVRRALVRPLRRPPVWPLRRPLVGGFLMRGALICLGAPFLMSGCLFAGGKPYLLDKSKPMKLEQPVQRDDHGDRHAYAPPIPI